MLEGTFDRWPEANSLVSAPQLYVRGARWLAGAEYELQCLVAAVDVDPLAVKLVKHPGADEAA